MESTSSFGNSWQAPNFFGFCGLTPKSRIRMVKNMLTYIFFCNTFGVLSGIFWSGIVSTFSMLYTYTSNSITNIEKGCATCRRCSSVDPTSQLTTTTPCPSMLFPFLLQIEYCLALTSLTRYMYNVHRPDTILDIFHIHSWCNYILTIYVICM